MRVSKKPLAQPSPKASRCKPSQARITDKKEQMERWVEHYLELYSTQNVVTDAALDAISQLPVLEELDEEPTVEELGKAIDALATGKAPGEDGIPPEVIKAGKEALIEDLHELLCLCWREGSVPSDMRGAKIVTLYKNKGYRSDCNSYLPTKHRRQSLCSSHLGPTTSPGGAGIPRVSVRV